jgi:hypothetical protein
MLSRHFAWTVYLKLVWLTGELLHASVLRLASWTDKNQCVFWHSLRSRPLKLLTLYLATIIAGCP